MLIEVLSCRRGMSNSGVVSRIAGDAIGADSFLPNMGTEDFLLCLSRQAMEAAAKEAKVSPRQKVRETRSALIEHFKDGHFVHASALFTPDAGEIADLMKHAEYLDSDETSTDTDATGSEDDAADGNVVEPTPPTRMKVSIRSRTRMLFRARSMMTPTKPIPSTSRTPTGSRRNNRVRHISLPNDLPPPVHPIGGGAVSKPLKLPENSHVCAYSIFRPRRLAHRLVRRHTATAGAAQQEACFLKPVTARAE